MRLLKIIFFCFLAIIYSCSSNSVKVIEPDSSYDKLLFKDTVNNLFYYELKDNKKFVLNIYKEKEHIYEFSFPIEVFFQSINITDVNQDGIKDIIIEEFDNELVYTYILSTDNKKLEFNQINFKYDNITPLNKKKFFYSYCVECDNDHFVESHLFKLVDDTVDYLLDLNIYDCCLDSDTVFLTQKNKTIWYINSQKFIQIYKKQNGDINFNALWDSLINNINLDSLGS